MLRFQRERVRVRAQDVQFVLDELTKLNAGRVDGPFRDLAEFQRRPACHPLGDREAIEKRAGGGIEMRAADRRHQAAGGIAAAAKRSI